MDFSNIDIKEMACFVYEILARNGIEAVLVGGACVSIYSHNQYQSYDLDFASYDSLRAIENILRKDGFKRRGRCFHHEKCPFIIDFVNPPIAIGNEPIHTFKTLQSSAGSLKLLTPTDCVKDRLSSFFHWNDQQAFEQALLVAQNHPTDLKNIKHWAKGEGHEDKFKLFLSQLKALK